MSCNMVLRFFLLVTVCLLGVNGDPGQGLRSDVNDEAFLDTPGMLTKHGYPVETHTVETDDGYILTMHRIPYSPLSPIGDTKKIPILVQHGLLSSSADWVLMGPGIGYAYILADAGYDVWLGNVRGNTYSKKHKYLDVNSKTFWDFSWHEQGIHDLPAEIDYIISKTGEQKIFYAGHCMGTTMFFVMCSQKPDYNSKIRAMFSLAPMAFMNHVTSPFFHIISLANKPLEWILNAMGVHEFLPSNELMDLGGKLLCQDGAITQAICSNVLFLIAGYDSKELNETMLPVILGHTPAGASTKQFMHYAQGIVSGYFRQYDYGLFGNLKKYGTITPPKYDLSKVTAPVALHYSRNDWLVGLPDVDRLHRCLGNPIGKFLVSEPCFNHLDFLWRINSKSMVYDKTILIMKEY